MKIIVDGRLLEEGRGGIASYFNPYLKKLLEDFPEDRFIVCGAKKISGLEGRNLEFHPLRSNFNFFKKLIRLYEAFIGFPKLLIKESGDLLLSPYYDFYVPLEYKDKSILTIHDLCFWDLPKNYSLNSKAFHKLLIYLNKSRLYKLVTVSNFSKKRIIQKLNLTPSGPIYNSFDKFSHSYEKENKISLMDRLGLESCFKYILYTSGLDTRKNIPRLLESFSRYCELADDARLICTGKEDHFNDYKDLVDKHGLADKIIFTGFLSQRDLEVLYKEIAHVIINVSLYEGFGRSNLEAMAYGVPLICSDIEVFKEVSGDYPTYVDPLNCSEIAGAIKIHLGEKWKRNEVIIDERFKFMTNYKKWKNLVLEFKRERFH